MEIIFDDIYKNKIWLADSKESLSGGGSNKEVNSYRIEFLKKFIENNKITHIYDICGDCNWQHLLVDKLKGNIKYIGFDVSQIAINKAIENNKNNKSMEFYKNSVDLCKTILEPESPDTSLIIIKEVIQHIPLESGIKMLQNIKLSGIKYIAITNFDKYIYDGNSLECTHGRNPILNPQNINVQIGSCYCNNMFDEPFNFKNSLGNVNNDMDLKYVRMYGNMHIFDIQEQEL